MPVRARPLIGLRGRAGAQTTEGELRMRVNVKRRRTLNRVGAFAALLLACVWVAGCGNDGTDQLTKAEFLKQGNAICAKGNGQIDTAGSAAFASPGNPTEQKTAAFAKRSLSRTCKTKSTSCVPCPHSRATTPR